MPKNEIKTPKGPVGSGEKAKDFKSAITKLIKELNTYKILLYIAFALAVIGSILSISAPSKLSKLTDEISKGLVVNQKNIEKVSKNAFKNFKKKILKIVVPQVLNLKLDQSTISEILTSKEIKNENKIIFKEIL